MTLYIICNKSLPYEGKYRGREGGRIHRKKGGRGCREGVEKGKKRVIWREVISSTTLTSLMASKTKELGAVPSRQNLAMEL